MNPTEEAEVIEAGNKLIQKFLYELDGMEVSYSRNSVCGLEKGNIVAEMFFCEMDYHSSWDWQIPAWSKVARKIQAMVSVQPREERDRYLISEKMKEPIRIQRKRTKGFKMPTNTVYVGRPSKWGNKFEVREMKDHTFGLFRTGKAHGLYGLKITYYPVKEDAIKQAIHLFEQNLSSSDIQTIREELKGKNLACFCKEGEPCHADILLKIANS